MRICVCVCVCVRERERESVCESVCVCVDGMNLKYPLRWHIHISSFCTMPMLYTSTRILKPFEDIELTGLKVDIAVFTLSPGEG